MKKLLLLIIVSLTLSLVGSVQAIWFNDIAGDGLWTTPENWDTGLVPVAGDWAKPRDGDTVYIFSGVDAVCKKVAIGTSTVEEGVSGLTVDGGTLTMPEDIVPGRSGDGLFTLISGTVNCRDLDVGYTVGNIGYVNITGGTLNLTRDLGLPNGDPGTTAYVTISGGTVNIGDDLDMDSSGYLVANDGGWLHLDRGTVNINDDLQMDSDGNGSTIDISFGTLTIGDSGTGNDDRVAAAIARGHLTGFGLADNVLVVDDGDIITITAASDPLNRVPTMDAYVNTNVALPLSWTNLPSDPAGGDVRVEIWFGTDPTFIDHPTDPNLDGYVDFIKVVDVNTPGGNVNITTANVDASIDGQQYAWRIDTFGTIAADPNAVVEGMTLYFTAFDDLPVELVVIDTTPKITWIDEPIHLTATIIDDGASPLTTVWTSDVAGAVFTNESYTYPTATVDVEYPSAVGEFTVTLEVSDDSGMEGTISDSVTNECAEDACQAAEILGLVALHPADIDGNCIIDLADLEPLVLNWMFDYTIAGPTPISQ